jgi:hypothetical protein
MDSGKIEGELLECSLNLHKLLGFLEDEARQKLEKLSRGELKKIVLGIGDDIKKGEANRKREAGLFKIQSEITEANVRLKRLLGEKKKLEEV